MTHKGRFYFQVWVLGRLWHTQNDEPCSVRVVDPLGAPGGSHQPHDGLAPIRYGCSRHKVVSPFQKAQVRGQRSRAGRQPLWTAISGALATHNPAASSRNSHHSLLNRELPRPYGMRRTRAASRGRSLKIKDNHNTAARLKQAPESSQMYTLPLLLRAAWYSGSRGARRTRYQLGRESTGAHRSGAGVPQRRATSDSWRPRGRSDPSEPLGAPVTWSIGSASISACGVSSASPPSSCVRMARSPDMWAIVKSGSGTSSVHRLPATR
jgi:hypothetical protein